MPNLKLVINPRIRVILNSEDFVCIDPIFDGIEKERGSFFDESETKEAIFLLLMKILMRKKAIEINIF